MALLLLSAMLLTLSNHVRHPVCVCMELKANTMKDMGQGGAMAIEDAISVAVLLPLGTTKQQIPERLRLYEKCRKERNELVLMYTRMNGRDEGDDSVRRMTGESSIALMRHKMPY